MSETMTQAKASHTEGPWRIADVQDIDWRVVENHRGHHVTDFVKPQDAALIAAAPDLLKAAKRALAVLKATGESVRSGNALGALDAAIAKAEGRE